MAEQHEGRGARAERIERQLAAAQQITHIGSWDWDLATNVVTWSDELYRIYGLEPRSREITLEVFLSFLDPADRDRVRGEVEAAIQRGGRFAYLERIVRPDGTRRELDTVGEVVTDDAGRTIALIGTCRDVTDERKRDEALQLHVDIVRNIQLAISVWRVEDPGEVRSARLVTFNPTAELVAGRPMQELVGLQLPVAFPGVDDPDLVGLLGAVARDGVTRELREWHFVPADGARRTLAVRGFPLPDRCVGLASEDITPQARSRELQSAEQSVLEQIAAGAPLASVLAALATAIEEHSRGGTIASVLLLDESGTRMRHGAAPQLPDEYNRAIDGAAIGPAAGSCGAAAYLRAPVFVRDIETDPRWVDYRELALRFGLRSCWSTPIFATDGHVAGTFALYRRDAGMPSPEELATIGRATHVAAIAIQRTELDERMSALSAYIEAAREEERTGVAREIHDELGQTLTALKMDVAWLGRRIVAEETKAPLLGRLESMSKMIDEIIDSVRRISSELRPGVLDDLGLFAAIEWQAQEFERRTGAICVVRSNVADAKLSRSFSTAIFRMFQEALTNVARHAEATHVEVSLERRGERLELRVHDDGKGISPEAAESPTSLGLLGARERARRMGGKLSVTRDPSGGTSFVVDVPLAKDEGGAP